MRFYLGGMKSVTHDKIAKIRFVDLHSIIYHQFHKQVCIMIVKTLGIEIFPVTSYWSIPVIQK